jgi:outer membrane protein assembly factor BamB
LASLNIKQDASHRKGTWRIGRIALLSALLVIVAVVGFGCVRGLAPIGWSAGAVFEGDLYVGSREGTLVAVNLADESRLWSVPLKAAAQSGFFGCSPYSGGGGCGGGSAGVAIYGTPLIYGDKVYLGGYNGKFYSYDVNSLQLDDVYPPEGNMEPIVGGAVALNGKVFFANTDGYLYAMDASNLLLEWRFATEDKIWSTPAVDGDTVYIGSFDNRLYAVNAYDGSQKWQFQAEGAIAATPLVYDGTIFIGSFDRNMYALNAADGSIRWQFMGENWFWAEPVIHNDVLYAGCLDGKVYALAVDTGRLVAEFELDAPVSSTPAVVDNSIVVASREGTVYTIDTGSRQMAQLAVLEEQVNGPLTAYESIVYVHSTEELTLHRINAVNGAILRPISLKSQD